MMGEPAINASMKMETGETWGNIHVRSFREDDAGELARFWREREFDIPGGLYDEANEVDGEYVLRTMRTEFTVRGTVAINGDEIVGYHELRRLNASDLLGCYFYITPGLRGTTFAARFLFTALQYVWTLPPATCKRFVIYVSPSNRVARSLYQWFGFLERRLGEFESVIPILLSNSYLTEFANRNKLFSSYRIYLRAFSSHIPGVRYVPPRRGSSEFIDRFKWKGLTIFPVRFRVNDEWVDILIDATTVKICYIACPDWYCSLVPTYNNHKPKFTVSAVNTSPRTLKVQLAKNQEYSVIAPGQVLSVEEVLRSEGNVLWPCQIEGHTVDLGAYISSNPNTLLNDGNACAPVSNCNPDQLFSLGSNSVTASLDLAQDGCVRSLIVSGKEVLRFSDTIAALAWIFPWKGGMFTLLQDWKCDFCFEPWGPFPGYVGFNTTTARCWSDGLCAWREARSGKLLELSRFVLEPDGMYIQSRIHNRGADPVSATFAVFVFLEGTGQGTKAYSAEGVSRWHSRRSFNLDSEQAVAIRMPQRTVRIQLAGGNSSIRAFNVGDDGIHGMGILHFTLGPMKNFLITARVQVE